MFEKSFNLYRPCVGICLLNKNKDVFIAHRDISNIPSSLFTQCLPYIKESSVKLEKPEVFNGLEKPSLPSLKDFLWQMPQGGIDEEEDIEQAARRELYEETGITTIEIQRITSDWFFYDVPESIKTAYSHHPSELPKNAWQRKYKGQRQKWVLAHFLGKEKEINLDMHPREKEFDAWQWVSPALLPDIVTPFKRDIYQSLLKEFFLKG